MTLTGYVLPVADLPHDDLALVRLAKKGDDSACEMLYVKYRRSAYAMALQYMRNREEALDVVQDAFLRFLTTIQRFDPTRPVWPWLRRIVRNLAIDRIRRRISHGDVGYETNEDGQVIEPPDTGPGQDDILAEHEQKRLLWEAVNRLDFIYREIIILREYQDLAYSEIAELLSIPIGTVMSRLHKARMMLREDLQGEVTQ